MQKQADTHLMAVRDIPVEDGALDMAGSSRMELYLKHAEAALTGCGREAAKKAVGDLPLEERYIWRIASSLRQAFCDFDKWSVRLDLVTIDAEEFDTVIRLIDRRVVQFAMLLRTVFGAEEMERMMLEAIDVAKRC